MLHGIHGVTGAAVLELGFDGLGKPGKNRKALY